MHYLILDTNVYLDLILGRDHSQIGSETAEGRSRTQHTFDYLNQVLTRSDVRLIVPEIVEREVEVKAGDLLTKYATRLNEMIAISRTLPLSVLGDSNLEVVESFRSTLMQWKDIVKDPEMREKVLIQFSRLLENARVIRTPVDDAVTLGVLRRQITRRSPFHRNGSQSYGDAAIIETITNLRRWQSIKVEPGDDVVFVSHNKADFSMPGKPDEFHPDLAQDVERALPEVVFTYTRHLFGVLKKRFGVSVPEEVVAEEVQAVERPNVFDPFVGGGSGFLDQVLVTQAMRDGRLASVTLDPGWRDALLYGANSTDLKEATRSLEMLDNWRRDLAEYQKVFETSSNAWRAIEGVETLRHDLAEQQKWLQTSVDAKRALEAIDLVRREYADHQKEVASALELADRLGIGTSALGRQLQQIDPKDKK